MSNVIVCLRLGRLACRRDRRLLDIGPHEYPELLERHRKTRAALCSARGSHGHMLNVLQALVRAELVP